MTKIIMIKTNKTKNKRENSIRSNEKLNLQLNSKEK